MSSHSMMVNYHTDSAPLLEPRLPQELERIIFEIAARNDRDKTMPVLMLVARRVRDWLQPIRYETLVLDSSLFDQLSESPLILPPRLPSRPQALHVRNLLVTGYQPKNLAFDWIEDLLPQCPNLQDLAIWCITPITSNILSLLTSAIQSPLRTVTSRGLIRLSASLAELFPDGHTDFHHEVFKDLTHLEVLDFPRESRGQWIEGNNYASLPSLRYLSIALFDPDFSFPTEMLRKCLEECKFLEVLILPEGADQGLVLLNGTREIVDSNGSVRTVAEDRVVVYEGPFKPKEGWTELWCSGVSGGDDPWIHAERIVQRRRKKKELDTSMWVSMLDPDADVDLGGWLTAMELL
ncbi:hypothetical protein AX16_006024 [Volvariella volvacea WC 439]|nr:hypothetical protein AX16_006024 [Volvariella volvacea WC 439]